MDLRIERDLTQEVLAEMAGTSPTTISNLESGKIKNPQYRTMRRIAAALGVDVEELIAPKAPSRPSPEPPEEVSEEERRYLAALLDPWTRQLRFLSDACGPRLRLLHPDALPYKELSANLSWTQWFIDTCILIERLLDDRSFTEAVNPWLSRMNDETVPAEIRQKLRDFDAARTKLFEELEPLAEERREALKERIPDEELVVLNAEEGFVPEERKDAATKDV